MHDDDQHDQSVTVQCFGGIFFVHSEKVLKFIFTELKTGILINDFQIYNLSLLFFSLLKGEGGSVEKFISRKTSKGSNWLYMYIELPMNLGSLVGKTPRIARVLGVNLHCTQEYACVFVFFLRLGRKYCVYRLPTHTSVWVKTINNI